MTAPMRTISQDGKSSPYNVPTMGNIQPLDGRHKSFKNQILSSSNELCHLKSLSKRGHCHDKSTGSERKETCSLHKAWNSNTNSEQARQKLINEVLESENHTNYHSNMAVSPTTPNSPCSPTRSSTHLDRNPSKKGADDQQQQEMTQSSFLAHSDFDCPRRSYARRRGAALPTQLLKWAFEASMSLYDCISDEDEAELPESLDEGCPCSS